MTSREAAELTVADKFWYGKSEEMQRIREETIAEREKIIQAAIDSATRVRWTREKPTKPGKWWYREDGNCEYYVASVVRIEGDLFAAMDGSQFYVDDCEGEWSDKPIKDPSDD